MLTEPTARVQKARFQGLLYAIPILLVALVSLLIIAASAPHRVTALESLHENWTFQQGNRRIESMALRDGVHFSTNEIATFSRTLDISIQNAVLFLYAVEQHIDVFIDDTLLFSNADDPLGYGTCFVPLPDDYEGKKITLSIQSPYKAYATSPRRILLGDLLSVNTHLFVNAIPRLLVMSITVFSGLILLMIAFISYLRRKAAQWSLLSLGAACVLWGISVISYDPLFMQLLEPPIAERINILSNAYYIFPYCCFFCLQATRFRKAIKTLSTIVGILVFILLPLDLLGILPMPQVISFYNFIFGCIAVSIVLFVVLVAIHGNRYARYVVVPVVLVVATVAGTVLNSNSQFLLFENLRVLSVFIYLCMTLLYSIRIYIEQRNEARNEMHILRANNDMIHAYAQAMSTYSENIHLLQHEIKHHLYSVSIMAQNNRVDDIASYTTNLLEQATPDTRVFYCNHMLINAILVRTASLSHQHDIMFRADLSIPEELDVADIDLTSLLMNLLDNALEACQKLSQSEREIIFTMKKGKDMIYITCKNKKSGDLAYDLRGNLKSTKQASPYHGHGMQAIRQVVMRYQGTLHLSDEEDWFHVRIVLCL